MTQIMRGVRVLEVASWTFVPAAGAVLADWGADVIKIEHPLHPDPQRALDHAGMGPLIEAAHGVNFIMEQPNRGKRSVGLDMGTPDGHELLMRLVEQSDVFLTNFLPQARQKLGIDVEHVRARNPTIIYARGTGQGTRGPDAEKPGFDGTAYVARGGFSEGHTPADREWPIQGGAAVGDLPGGLTIAGGISAALFHRERTGEPCTVDVSLLGVAMWTMAPSIIATRLYGLPALPRPERTAVGNPLSIMYRTGDGRFVKLSMFQSDRFFADLCEHLDCPDLADDPRFIDATTRAANRGECVEALDRAFEKFTLDDLKRRFQTLKGAWAPVQRAVELHDDPQAIANGYLSEVESDDGFRYRVVSPPIEFDESPNGTLKPGPQHGAHTEEVLLEMGLSWDEILTHKASGAVL